MDDTQLRAQFALLQQGDKEALETLYRELSAPLFTIILRITQDRGLAEDVLQEVYAQYGDMVRFEDCTGMRFVLTDETGSPDGAWYDAGADKTQTHQYAYVLALFAFALFAFCAVWLTRFRGTPVFQAATGKTAAARRTSRKEAAARIRHSTAAPDAAVLSSLLQKIETS